MTTTTEMTNTKAFTSKREVILSLMEVTQDNFCRYALKLINSYNSNVITLDELGAHTDLFRKYCKAEGIDDTILIFN